MPLLVDPHETRWLIRAEGDVSVNCAAELKRLLLDGLASGKELQVDLTHADEIDITVLQLLWAADHDPARKPGPLVSGVSDAAGATAKDAGFECFPGLINSGVPLG